MALYKTLHPGVQLQRRSGHGQPKGFEVKKFNFASRRARFIGVLMILLGCLAGVTVPSAQAAPDAVATSTSAAAAIPVQTQPASLAAATSWPSDMSGVRFTYRSMCVHTNVDIGNFPVDWAAQKFNVQSSYILKLQYSTNCVAAGYDETQFFSVVAVNQPNSTRCVTTPSTNRTQYWNGMYHWAYVHPTVYINMGNPDVCGGLYHLDTGAHNASQAVGLMLGLKQVCGSAWAARVMEWCFAQYETDVYWASKPEGTRVAEIYQGVYGG